MPLYEYKCDKCEKVFSELRNMAEREDPIECPECGGKGKIMFSTFAQGSSSSPRGAVDCPSRGVCETPT